MKKPLNIICTFLFSGLEVIKVVATDADEPLTDNSDILYKIIDQEPKLPAHNLFEINPQNGVIRVNAGGLDREVRLLKPMSPVLVCFHIYPF